MYCIVHTMYSVYSAEVHSYSSLVAALHILLHILLWHWALSTFHCKVHRVYNVHSIHSAEYEHYVHTLLRCIEYTMCTLFTQQSSHTLLRCTVSLTAHPLLLPPQKTDPGQGLFDWLQKFFSLGLENVFHIVGNSICQVWNGVREALQAPWHFSIFFLSQLVCCKMLMVRSQIVLHSIIYSRLQQHHCNS